MYIKEIIRYPIKGCAGENFSEVHVDIRGIDLDRQWLVIDEIGRSVAQRPPAEGDHGIGIPEMCMVRVEESAREMVVTAPGMPKMSFPKLARTKNARLVHVWSWKGGAVEVGSEISRWFTEYLSRYKQGEYRLVQIAKNEHRFAKTGGAELSFADGFPILVISDASLDLLNRQPELEGNPVPMNRFRPNIVIAGCDPHAEDELALFSQKALLFEGQKLCDRCNVPGIDQKTGKRDNRPVKALNRYRRKEDGKIYFGRNFVHKQTGVIRLGQITVH